MPEIGNGFKYEWISLVLEPQTGCHRLTCPVNIEGLDEQVFIAKAKEAELAILQVLWEKGPSTVRQIQDELQESRGTGYTTTLKLMQIMFEREAHNEILLARISTLPQ